MCLIIHGDKGWWHTRATGLTLAHWCRAIRLCTRSKRTSGRCFGSFMRNIGRQRRMTRPHRKPRSGELVFAALRGNGCIVENNGGKHQFAATRSWPAFRLRGQLSLRACADQRGNSVTMLNQLWDQKAAKITGAAGDEDFSWRRGVLHEVEGSGFASGCNRRSTAVPVCCRASHPRTGTGARRASNNRDGCSTIA